VSVPDILMPADYAQVRAVCDLSLDVVSLPDERIGLDVFVGEAEDEVKRLDPAWAAHLAADATGAQVVRAAVYLTAARIVPWLPVLTGNSFADERHTRAAYDPAARAADLRAKAFAALATYLPPDSVSALAPLPTVFTVASGTRGY
jgi:hypothetical protein